MSAQSRRLLKQLRSPPPSPESSPYPYLPPCSYACDTAKSLGIGLLAGGLAMVLYLLIRLFSNCLSRCDQPRATEGGAAPRPKARDLSFIPTKVVCGGRDPASRQDCAICLARFSDGETIRVLPRCKHVFHRECLDPWLHSMCTASSLCPVCRDPVKFMTGYTSF